MTSINYIPFYADDVEEQVKFFTEKLGFLKIEKANLYGKGNFALVSAPGSKVMIAISDDMEFEDLRSYIIISIDDCLKAYHHLKEAGLTFSKAPHYRAAGLVAEFADDYDNRFMLLEERNYNEDL